MSKKLMLILMVGLAACEGKEKSDTAPAATPVDRAREEQTKSQVRATAHDSILAQDSIH